jgi:hypothetical protein
MDRINCPDCSNPATRMPVLSYVSRSDNFYYCDWCKQVSQMPKDASSRPMILRVNGGDASPVRV